MASTTLIQLIEDLNAGRLEIVDLTQPLGPDTPVIGLPPIFAPSRICVPSPISESSPIVTKAPINKSLPSRADTATIADSCRKVPRFFGGCRTAATRAKASFGFLTLMTGTEVDASKFSGTIRHDAPVSNGFSAFSRKLISFSRAVSSAATRSISAYRPEAPRYGRAPTMRSTCRRGSQRPSAKACASPARAHTISRSATSGSCAWASAITTKPSSTKPRAGWRARSPNRARRERARHPRAGPRRQRSDQTRPRGPSSPSPILSTSLRPNLPSPS